MDKIIRLKLLIELYENATKGVEENEMMLRAFEPLPPDMQVGESIQPSSQYGLPIAGRKTMGERVQEIKDVIQILAARKKSSREEIISILEEIKNEAN